MKVKFLARAFWAVALGAIMLAGATGAWACFPLPVLSVQPRASGPVGATVTVEGVDFGVGNTEVRWNAIDGPLLGRGSAGRFTVPVTIPQADDGVYSIVALARLPDDTVGVKAVTPFQVSSHVNPPTAARPPPALGAVSTPTPSSTSSGPSTAATAGLALGGAGILALAGLGGALLARRRRPQPEQPAERDRT